LGTALIIYFQFCGDELSRTMSIAKLTERLSRQSSLAPLDELWTYTIRIFVPSHSGQHSDCVRLAKDALRLADESGIHIIDALFYGDGLHGALCGNDLKTSDTMLAGMERAMAERPLNLDKAYYHHIQGWRVRLDGNNAGAVEHARSALTIAQRIGAGYPEIMCRYGLAHALLANGDLENSKSESAWIRTKVEAAGLRWMVYLCDLFDAQCAFMSGDDETGNRRLCSAMASQEKYDMGFFYPLWRHEDILALYVKAMEHGCITTYVLRHIREQQLVPKQNSLIPDSWPFPIKLYTFGRFSLLIDDKPVQFTNRGQKKPMELLKALIALGGRDVPQAEIIDLLWPDTEGDASYRSLITCLQRLRNIIGYKDAVIHTESRMTLDTRYIWSDNWAFERLINHAEVMEKEGSQDKACETRIKALGYYKGSFLEKDTEMAWTLSMREQLRVKFIRQVELIGRYWEGANNWDKALECYQKALSIDNLSEVFYQRLMTAYKMLGRDSDAILAYQRCCKELSSRLGIPPSPATEEIYNSIQKR
jgi:DNA-binding SARP family transcriptional activator